MLHRKTYSTFIFSSDLLSTANNKGRFNHIARHLRNNDYLRDELQVRSVSLTSGMYKGTAENTFIVEANVYCDSIQTAWNEFIFCILMQECYIMQDEYNDIYLVDSFGTRTKAKYIQRNTNKSDYVIVDGVKTYINF